ncbi:MAG TPA: cellulase family glycosylhydrolase [Polyangiaceae bacterium]|jgi:mannan endo-1,4-beta-mannosidase
MATNENARAVGRRGARAPYLAAVASIAFAIAGGAGSTARADGGGPGRSAFVRTEGSEVTLDGRPFALAGSNTYYLSYKSTFMVDDALGRASAQGSAVVRTWGWIDIGNEDGSNSTVGKADGVVYFHFFDGTAPAFNDGADGLQHLDYAIYRAGQLGLKLVIPFVGNWTDFGGMDQYVRWLGGQFHDQFYTDPTIRGWYKAYIAHLLGRINSITGVAYKDDPTIAAWELANEPRCIGGSAAYPASGTCTTKTLVAWADDVSSFIKRIDHHHLVEVGDEGFYCSDPTSSDFTENCSQGVDTIALASLPNVDMMSFHLYPDNWLKDVAFGTQWIHRHFQDARKIRRPALFGEFGIEDVALRNADYKMWTDAVLEERGAGALYWMLGGLQDDGTLYFNDGFTLYCPTPVCTAFSHFTADLKARHRLPFAPVADVDLATTATDVAVTLDPPENDVAYDRAKIVPASLDLDPTTAGVQTTWSSAAGTFTANADGTVLFTPAAGFAGTATASYTIDDSYGRSSAVTPLTVTVKGPILPIESFETGTDGWAFGSFQTNAGTVMQTSAFATDGTSSLAIDATGGGWVGTNFSNTIDLSQKSQVLADIETLAAGTSTNIAIQAGNSFTWCQGPSFGFTNASSTATVDLDLGNLDCLGNPVPDLSQVHAMWIFFGANGTFYLDNVRAQQ